MMTIKELLLACDPDLEVQVHRSCQAPDKIKTALELFAEVMDQPDERLRLLKTDHEVLVIGLYSKR